MGGAVPQPGDRLDGRFRLERRLGSGGMASVWLALDESLDREVAIKLLSGERDTDPGDVDGFAREARIAASLSHPNLVEVFDFGVADGRPYLVMELIGGGTLADAVGRRDPDIDPFDVAAGLLSALASLHERDLVHGDVKAENVLIDDEHRVRLTDFGVASPRGADTPRSDLLAAGVLLNECFGANAPTAIGELAAALRESDAEEDGLTAAEALGRLERSAEHATRELPADGAWAETPPRRAPTPVKAPEPEPAVTSAGLATPKRYVHVSVWRVALALIAAAGLAAAGILTDDGRSGRPLLPLNDAQAGPGAGGSEGSARTPASRVGTPVLPLGRETRVSSR